MEDREFMEWFIDELIDRDIFWDSERDELVAKSIDYLVQAGKIKYDGYGRKERV